MKQRQWGDLFVDKGDYDRTGEADEIFIRVTEKESSEIFDLCRFGADETGEPFKNAQRIVTAVNSYDDMLEAFKEIAECDGNKLDGKDAAGFIAIAKRIIAKATNSK